MVKMYNGILFSSAVSFKKIKFLKHCSYYIFKPLPSLSLSLVVGNWSNWGPWSACSETCGNGTRNRTRLCNNPAPDHGGASCEGDADNREACLVRHCPGKTNFHYWCINIYDEDVQRNPF